MPKNTVMLEKNLKRLALCVLIFVAAGIAFWTSFRNAVDMASIVRTDADGILRVYVLNSPEDSADSSLCLRVEYKHADLRGNDGGPLALPFPKPFTAVLVNDENQIIAQLGAPDAEGKLPPVENLPRDEKYFWIGFPKITEDGKPVSLLIRNPFYSR